MVLSYYSIVLSVRIILAYQNLSNSHMSMRNKSKFLIGYIEKSGDVTTSI